MAQPLIMFNSISSGNDFQARYNLSQPSIQNQPSYDSSNLTAQNQTRYDSSNLSAQNQTRYDDRPTSNFSAQHQDRYDSSNLTAQNPTVYDSSKLSVQNQARYNSPNLSAPNQGKSDSPSAQLDERFYTSSPAAQPFGLYSNQGRFDPPNMMAQQQARLDATNTLLAQQQARYYTQLQAGYYAANSIPNSQSVFHSPNMLSHYQPGFYYPMTQQMLLGSNISSGYSYPFQSYNLNSTYGGNTYFNMNSLQPMSVNHQQLPIQQAVGSSSPSTAASNMPSISPDSQKMDTKKTKQVKRKQKENEPKASKSQQRKKRKKQEPVVKEENEAESVPLFQHPQNPSMSVVSSTSVDFMQNLQIYKEQIKTSQQDLQLWNGTQPQNEVSPSALSIYNQNDTSSYSEPNVDNIQKCNPSIDSVYNIASVQNQRQYDNKVCKEDARVTEACYTANTELNTSKNENMNCLQTTSEKYDKSMVSELVKQDKMQNDKNHEDVALQMPVSDGQLSSSFYNQYENSMQTNVYQRNTYYNHLYKEVVDLSVKSSENKSLNTAYQTKIDSGLKKSQLFEASVTSSSESNTDSAHQPWLQDDMKDFYPPKVNETDSDDTNVFKNGEDLYQTAERPFTDRANTCDYNMPKDEPVINKTHPVALLNQMITKLDKGKACLTGSVQQMENDKEHFPRYDGYQGCVIDGSQDALKNIGTCTNDYNHSYGVSGYDYNNVPVPNKNLYQNYHNKPIDITKSDSYGEKNRDVHYQKENSQILNCETLSTNQSLSINTKEFSQIRPQFDSPVEVKVYPEKTIEDFRCKKFWDSQIYQYTKSTQESEDSHFNFMQKDSIVSAGKESASLSTSPYKADTPTNYSMQTVKQPSDPSSVGENMREEESSHDKFQADRFNEKTFGRDDFDSKWEIIYSSQSKEKQNGTVIESKISEKSHEMNYNQDYFDVEKSKAVSSSEQKGDQPLYENFQRCFQPDGTVHDNDRTPTSSEDLSKWEIIYSKENVNDKKCANSLTPEYQIMAQSAKHSVEDYKISTESSVQSLDHRQQIAECDGMPQNASSQLKIKEENVDFKCTSPKASIAVEFEESSKVKVENTDKVDSDLNHENTTGVQSLNVKDEDVNVGNKDVDSVKRKLFFQGVVRRSTKRPGKQAKEETGTCRVRNKQTHILSFFKKDNSSKNTSLSNHPFACQKSTEIRCNITNAALICDNLSNEPLENSQTVTRLGKPSVPVPGTQNGNHKLKAKTCDEKQFKGGEKIFMSRGKQILFKSQQQGTATMQFDMQSKALTFKTPAFSLKTAGYHKKIPVCCKGNKRLSLAKVRSKVLAAVNLRDTPGSKVCPSISVREIKYLSPLNREFGFNTQATFRYLVIKVEDMTRMYKPVVSQLMITGATPTSARQEAALYQYQYTGTSSSNLRLTTTADNNYRGNSCSEKTSVLVPALAKKVCDICGCCYNCTMDQHMNSDKHQSCINKPGFYAGLDELISSIGCIDKLITSLKAHSTSAIVELLQGNTNPSSDTISKHSRDELCMTKAYHDHLCVTNPDHDRLGMTKDDHIDQSYCTTYLSTKSVFQIVDSALGVQIKEAFRSDFFVDKTLIVQAARLNVINPPTTSRKRKNIESMENTVVFKQRKTSSKQCCTNIAEGANNCVHLSALFDNINIHSSDKNSNDATNPDNLKDKTMHSIDFDQQIMPDICSNSVSRPKRQVRLPRFIKVKKPKSKVITFRVPSPNKVKVLSLAASENIFQQCIDELMDESLNANSKKLFSLY